jgi:hypothetical protein
MMVLDTPDAPTIPEHLSEQEQQEYMRLHGLAYHLSHNMAGAYVYAAISATIGTGRSDLEGHQLYVQQLLKEAGNPKDPVERMLIEQLALAHHNIGRLSMRAADARTLEETRILEGAMARLISEFRKTSLALKEFREPTARRQFTLIKQQNLAHNQQVAYVDSEQAGECAELTAEKAEDADGDSELCSIPTEAIEHVEQTNPLAQSQSSRCREEEPLEA